MEMKKWFREGEAIRIELTVRWQEPQWRYATPIIDVLCPGLYRAFSLLQEAGRARHGAMPR